MGRIMSPVVRPLTFRVRYFQETWYKYNALSDDVQGKEQKYYLQF